MTRYATTTLALLLSVITVGTATAQHGPAAGKPPATNDTSGMAGDKAKNAESAPASSGTNGPAAAGTMDVSPGVGTVEGADAKPPIPAGSHK